MHDTNATHDGPSTTATTIITPTRAVAERDAAKYIGYTPAALRSWRRQGRGPAYIQYARSVRYLVADLDAWIAAHRVAR